MSWAASFVAAAILALQIPVPAPSTDDIASADAAFAAGLFRTAFAGYQHVLRDDPHNADALAGAGTIELYGNDLRDAQRDLSAAAAAGNARAQRELQILQRRMQPLDVQQNAGSETIRLESVEPLPIVRISVNGVAANFFIDTGAGNVVLSDAFARSLRLSVRDSRVGTFAGGRHAQVRSTYLRTFSVGPYTARDLQADVVRLPQMPAPYPISGILGTGFLSQFLTTIDFQHAALTLVPQAESRLHVKDLAGAENLPMWLVGDHFIFARGHVNVAPDALFNIDTGGAGFGVQLTKASLDAAHISVDERNAQRGIGGGGTVSIVPFTADVTLGKTTVKGVPGVYTPAGDQYGIFPFAVAGTITQEYFRHLRVTFDFNAMRLYLQS